ncbi:MAG TPA: hypothetical protein VNO26_03465 [Candidatus Limnocylindria bacterium]|nr:hypothetical protein [Candidatus Limnocylindria bacterium]
MTRRAGRTALGVWVVVAIAVAGCARMAGRPEAPEPRAAGTRRVAVLPFRVQGFIDSYGRFASDPEADAMPDDLGAYVAERLTSELEKLGAPVVPASTVLQATPVAGAALYDSKLAVRVARTVGADAAVYGAVHRFVQRKGSALSVERPASVEYRALVVDAASGMVIGNYLFDFTQQPLAADLTTLPDFIQGGGKWRTREEILDGSLAKTAAKIRGTLGAPTP